MVSQILDKQVFTQEPLIPSHIDQDLFSINEALKIYVIANKEQLILVGEDEMEEDDEEEVISDIDDDSFNQNDSKNYQNVSIGSIGKDYSEIEKINEYSPVKSNDL